MISTDSLHAQVIAVPPLARNQSGAIDHSANDAIVDHLRGGGVRTLLYGGNAMFYHLTRDEYVTAIKWLRGIADTGGLVIPSLGPSYGLLRDHADILKEYEFPTAMILPQRDIADRGGIVSAVRETAERLGQPIVLYIKFDHYLDVNDIQALFDDGLVDWIKYAIVRDDPAKDDYLRELVSRVDPKRIVSGIGEQPAIVHLRDFGVGNYTSGCVCVAPSLSQKMLGHCRRKEWDAADAIRHQFEALEDLRNNIHPITVLHQAVESAGIASTGSMIPLLSGPDGAPIDAIETASKNLRQSDSNALAK